MAEKIMFDSKGHGVYTLLLFCPARTSFGASSQRKLMQGWQSMSEYGSSLFASTQGGRMI